MLPVPVFSIYPWGCIRATFHGAGWGRRGPVLRRPAGTIRDAMWCWQRGLVNRLTRDSGCSIRALSWTSGRCGCAGCKAELACNTHSTSAGVEDRGLVYQAEGSTTSLMDAIRNVFLRPADGEIKVNCMGSRAVAATSLPLARIAQYARVYAVCAASLCPAILSTPFT